MTAKILEIVIPTISLPTIGIGGVDWRGVSPVKPSHPHDDVANWLWDDGGCILWDNGGVIKL